MIDWYEGGRALGLELSEKQAASISLPAENMAFDDVKAWIDGVLDGIDENGRRANGIRISNALLPQMGGIKDDGAIDHYRGYPYVGAEQFWPEDKVEVVLLR